MVRSLTAAAAVALMALSAPAALVAQSAAPVNKRSTLHDFRVVTVVDAMVQPWSIAFLPGGDLLITERPGRLRIVRQGKMLAEPVAGVPAVHHSRQGGLFEVMLHPEFATNRFLYLTYSKPGKTEELSTTVLVRGKFENDRLTEVKELFVADAKGAQHYSGKLAFDGKGYLFLSLGDRQVPPEGKLEAHPAQDLSNHHGKIIRLHDDGRVPKDNPFVSRAGAKPEIWSYGHRNVQGLVFNAATGDLWANEHGPQGGDELNRIEAGKNYGWPVIGFGVNYTTGLAIHAGTQREGMEQPVSIWVPSIGVSSAMIYTGDKFPQWRNNLFVGGMSRQKLVRLTLDKTRVVEEEAIMPNMGRVREVKQSPDGFIYILTDDRDGKATPIYRLEPVARATS